MNDAWARAEAQQVMARSQILSQTQESVAAGLRKSFELKWKAEDRAFKGWSQAMLGTKEVYDPLLGEKWTVPNSAESYWLSASQTLVGTQTQTAPGPEFRELIQLKP